VGAHIVNQASEEGVHVYYWREKGKEVDFVLQQGSRVTAIEEAPAKNIFLQAVLSFN